MKYIGFIKEYDKISEALSLDIYINSYGDNYDIDRKKLIDYLKNGEVVLSWMGVFTDFENNNYISPHMYYTDGKWIWPSYLIYYLKKKQIFI